MMFNQLRPALQIGLYISAFSKYGLKLSFIVLYWGFLKLKTIVKRSKEMQDVLCFPSMWYSKNIEVPKATLSVKEFLQN